MGKCAGRCWYCGTLPEPDRLTVDHAKPKSLGGKNYDSNLLPACERCNNLKGNLTVSEFRKYVKALACRKLMSLGQFHAQVRIVFYGEGNDSPLRW